MAQYKYSRDDYYRLTNAPCIDVALALGMEINERASWAAAESRRLTSSPRTL